MAELNLAPPQIKKQHYQRQVVSLMVFSLLIIVVILGIVFAGLFMVNQIHQQSLNQVSAKLAEEELKAQQLKPIEDKALAINKRLKKMSNLKQENLVWSNILYSLNQCVPKKVQIKALQLNQETYQVSISGAAESRREIVRLQEKLNDNLFFQNFGFSSSSFDNVNGLYQFNMMGEVKHEPADS